MNTKAASFKGDKKLPLKSPLAKAEHKLIDWWTPRFPRRIEGYHLTLMTVLWSGGLVLSGWLARQNLHWLWLASAMMVMQWFTDCFDGALGRYRDTGIPKWGYYMDHFLDFMFMCCALTGYALLFDGLYRTIFLLLIPVFGAFMVNSYLSFAATSEFKITFLGTGPTELRLAMILFNTAMIVLGTGFVRIVLPFAPAAAVIALLVVVFRTQKYIWRIDMEDKRQRQAQS